MLDGSYERKGLEINRIAFVPIKYLFLKQGYFTQEEKYWLVNYVYTVEDIQVFYVHPSNGDRTTTLNIYQNEDLIFSRTTINEGDPFVEITKICPSDTCPVRCGDRVCCYGSDGIATDTFLLSDSIYS